MTQSHLMAVRYANGTKAMYRIDDVASFKEAYAAAKQISAPVALVLVQPIPCKLQEAA